MCRTFSHVFCAVKDLCRAFAHVFYAVKDVCRTFSHVFYAVKDVFKTLARFFQTLIRTKSHLGRIDPSFSQSRRSRFYLTSARLCAGVDFIAPVCAAIRLSHTCCALPWKSPCLSKNLASMGLPIATSFPLSFVGTLVAASHPASSTVSASRSHQV
jgi:hypothetical protein